MSDAPDWLVDEPHHDVDHGVIKSDKEAQANLVERIADIKMTKDEQAMFDKSVAAVKGLVDACKGIDPTLA